MGALHQTPRFQTLALVTQTELGLGGGAGKLYKNQPIRNWKWNNTDTPDHMSYMYMKGRRPGVREKMGQ